MFDSVNKYTAVSLFCGAGGLDMGFESAGFNTVWANDIDKDACDTHRSWSKAEVVDDDIRDINFDNIPQTDIILGGFPCQGFSLAGPRKIDDKRNTLYQFFAGLVGQKQPLAFVAENVKGIRTLGNGLILDAIVADFKERGYILKYMMLMHPTMVYLKIESEFFWWVFVMIYLLNTISQNHSILKPLSVRQLEICQIQKNAIYVWLRIHLGI